jgi:hypothetical protein
MQFQYYNETEKLSNLTGSNQLIAFSGQFEIPAVTIPMKVCPVLDLGWGSSIFNAYHLNFLWNLAFGTWNFILRLHPRP